MTNTQKNADTDDGDLFPQPDADYEREKFQNRKHHTGKSQQHNQHNQIHKQHNHHSNRQKVVAADAEDEDAISLAQANTPDGQDDSDTGEDPVMVTGSTQLMRDDISMDAVPP